MGNDKLLVGCVYRSPNANNVYNSNVNKFISKITQMKYSHILILGDFNYPDISWDTWTTNSNNENDINNLFLNAVKDSYMSQHVDQPTRIRGSQVPSLIDLVLTNEPGMVNNVEIQSPLGASDHGLLAFTFYCYNVRPKNAPLKYQFSRGDYCSMKQDISTTKWNEVFSPDDSVDELWKKFSKVVQESMAKHIPKKKMMSGKSTRYYTPLDRNAIRKI